jgi:hypothetical protein
MPDFKMSRPAPGDVVLFSTDVLGFSSPVLGWVTDTRGECTVNILTFTTTGFVQRSSVHHKDDPDLRNNPGWEELGCWDYAPLTRCIHELTHGQAKPAGK